MHISYTTRQTVLLPGIYKQIFEFNHSYIALAFSDFAFAFV